MLITGFLFSTVTCSTLQFRTLLNYRKNTERIKHHRKVPICVKAKPIQNQTSVCSKESDGVQNNLRLSLRKR